MRYENNVIELKNYRVSSYICGIADNRRADRGRLRRILEDLAAAAEVMVSAAIGIGFAACVLLFCTML